ncbi:unnamed protein product, partial [Rotaria magnacalcarata]
RTAVGIYLCKLRLGISNRLLACIFQIADKQTVSRIINSARQAIVKSFVLGNLGFGHVTREDVIGRHTTTIARELMCGGDSTDTAIIIIDGTYLYIQHDILVVDRGFRDSIGVMKALGLQATMPSFLDGRRQFSAEEANKSRCITKIRWVVEAANRRLKQFKYFANTIQNSSLVYLESDMSIACALINHYQPPMARSKLEDEEIGVQIMQLRQQKNKIQL